MMPERNTGFPDGDGRKGCVTRQVTTTFNNAECPSQDENEKENQKEDIETPSTMMLRIHPKRIESATTVEEVVQSFWTRGQEDKRMPTPRFRFRTGAENEGLTPE
jgi:hypothetical protein